MKIKQRNIPWLGALVDSLYTSLPILSIINFLSILTVLYATTREYLVEWVPWLTYSMFLGFLVILTLCVMVFIYKFVIPSIWTFRGKQLYGFESELMQEVRELRKEVEGLKEDLQRKENGYK